MTTLWNTYSDQAAARRAVDALLAAGVPAADVRLLVRSRWHDVRSEPVGEFGAVAQPNDPVATFANVRTLRREGTGSFAGDPARQREGSFADTDLDVVVTYERDRARSHLTGDDGIRRLLRDTALEHPATDRILTDLRAGKAVVIAEIPDAAPTEIRSSLGEGDHAA